MAKVAALVGQPRTVLDAMARSCRTQSFGFASADPVDRADRARFAPLAGTAKLAVLALRGLGALRLLQALKDDPRLAGLFFRPADPAAIPVLGDAAAARLDLCYAECLAAIAAASERLDEGPWLTRVARTDDPASRPGT